MSIKIMRTAGVISIKGCRDAQFQLEIYNRKQVYIPVKVWISLSQTIVWKINDSRQSPLQFYFFDVGVYRTLRPMGPLDAPEEVDGIALETLFLQELIALNSAFDFGYKFFTGVLQMAGKWTLFCMALKGCCLLK
jgi:hypothetical protein